MADFKLIQLSLIVMLAPQFTAAKQLVLYPIVRDGATATLSCENVIDSQNNCDSTTWVLGRSRSKTIELIKLGQIGENAKDISDRLSVMPNCSLVIKKVRAEDAGRYICQQYVSDKRQDPDADVYLSIITITEHKDTDEVNLTCSVSTYERCKYKVKWLYNGNDVGKEVKTSKSSCSASLHLQTNNYIYETRFRFLRCAVTKDNKEQQFPFNPQPSGEGTTTATTKSATKLARMTEDGSNARIITTAPVINDALAKLKGRWWLYIVAAVVLVALLIIIVVIVIKMKRTKGNKKRPNDKVGLTSNSAVTQSSPEANQDMAAPEDDISYASISYTRTTNSKGQVRSKNDDTEDHAVTYMKVKASSTDPINLYATVNTT